MNEGLWRWVRRTASGYELTDEAADRITVLSLVAAPDGGVSERTLDEIGVHFLDAFMHAIIASSVLEVLELGVFVQQGGAKDGEFMYKKLSDEQKQMAQKMLTDLTKHRT